VKLLGPQRPLINSEETQATSTTSAMSTPTTSTMSTSYHQQGHIMCQQAQHIQWNDNDTIRPRSRAIAIKNRDRCAEDLASSQNVATASERRYDWATRRMHDRIVEHRRNQNFSAPSYLPSLRIDQPDSLHLQNMAFASNGLPSSDYAHDEVFELDI
jgi:hypothetical protein